MEDVTAGIVSIIKLAMSDSGTLIEAIVLIQ